MAITVTAAHVAESFDSGNMKEDCSDIIFNIDPSDTPVLSNSGRRDVSNTTFEWNTESLPSHESSECARKNHTSESSAVDARIGEEGPFICAGIINTRYPSIPCFLTRIFKNSSIDCSICCNDCA